MKLKGVIFYLVAFVLVGTFYYIYTYGPGGGDMELEDSGDLVYQIEFDQVDGLRLVQEGTEFEIIRTAPDAWVLRKPIETQADRWAVEGLIRSVLAEKKDRVFADPIDDMAQFGLDKPEVSLTLLSEGQPLGPPLQIGQANPVGQLYYARLGEDSSQVFTLLAAFRRELTKSLFDLRDKSLVMFPGEKIDKLILAGEEPVELAKKGIRSWEIVKPETAKADDDEVQKLLYQGLKGRVKEFVDPEEGKDYGFDQPLAEIQVVSGDQVAARIIVGKPVEEEKPEGEGGDEAPQPNQPKTYWIKSTERDQVMVVDEAMYEKIALGLKDLKDRHVLEVDRRAVNELKITRGEALLEAEKKVKDIWEVLKPSDAKSQDFHISRFLMAMEDLRYDRLLDSEPETISQYGLDQPDMVVEMSAPEKPVLKLSLSLEPVEEKFLAVRVDQGPVALVAKGAILDSLPDEVRPEEKPAPPDEEAGAGDDEEKK